MSERYNITHIKAAAPDDLYSGIWLMLYQPRQIPPHLVLIVEGEYFSLSVKGTRIREHVSGLIRNIQAKAHPVLAIKVKLTGVPDVLQREAEELFNHYKAPEAGKITCLYPIRDFFALHAGEAIRKAEFVFELYDLLLKSGKTGRAVHYFLENELNTNSEFVLSTYTRSDIDSCIDQLRKEERGQA